MDEQERALVPSKFEVEREAAAEQESIAQPQELVLNQIKLSAREKWVILIVVGTAAVGFLFMVRGVLPPFIAGIAAAYALNPLVNWLSAKTKLGRRWVVLVMALVVALLLAWLGYFVVDIVGAEIRDLIRNWPTILESAEKNVFGDAPPPSFFGAEITPRSISEAIRGYMGDFPRNAVTAVTRTVETLGTLLIFFITTFLLLLDAKKLAIQGPKLIPVRYRDEAISLGRQINRTLGAYIRGQLILFVLMSSVTWIVLGPILQLRYAVVVSLATGVMEWFPIIGPITAGTIAVIIGLFQPNVFGWHPWIYGGVIALVYAVLRHLEDYLVIPHVIGRAVHLPALVVLFALFSGGAVAGILGMFIAVPVAAVVRIAGEYIYRKLTT